MEGRKKLMTVADKLREEGRVEGIKEGSYETKVKVARNMLMKNMKISEVKEFTELSREEIEKNIQSLNK